MTVNRFKAVLDRNFKTWKVRESLGTLKIRVKGPIHADQIHDIDYFRPAHVDAQYYTMGFLESLFCWESSWKTKF